MINILNYFFLYLRNQKKEVTNKSWSILQGVIINNSRKVIVLFLYLEMACTVEIRGWT